MSSVPSRFWTLTIRFTSAFSVSKTHPDDPLIGQVSQAESKAALHGGGLFSCSGTWGVATPGNLRR